MELYIMEEDMIRNIQRNFREKYPHLELQFYRNLHKKGQSLPAHERLSPELTIEDVAMFYPSGKINISPERTVADVERDFFRLMGLCVQVFRQSGNAWLETVYTDNWSLQQQENRGRTSLGYSISIERQVENFNMGDVG